MDLYEYSLLPFNHKAQFVWDNGNFLTNRVDDYGRKINLYHMGKFFVELVMDGEFFNLNTQLILWSRWYPLTTD